MGKSVLKWLAALGTGVAVALVSYLAAHVGNGPDLGDPTANGIVALILAKLMAWLTSKVPAEPTTLSR
jgi:hypothetical protein